jgi:futalosine hydrolase
MNILLVSSTTQEIKPFWENLKVDSDFSKQNSFAKIGKHQISVLISGIGIVSTIYYLTKKLFISKYDLVINAGICGSFSENLKIGTTVNVVSDEFADLGAEENSGFKSLFDIGLLKPDDFPFNSGRLISDSDFSGIETLKKVNGITVNSVSGNEKTIAERRTKFSPDAESMEGAAVFYVCLSEKIPVLQIRSVSNLVEIRNKENWNIKLAVNNLNLVLENIFFKI